MVLLFSAKQVLALTPFALHQLLDGAIGALVRQSAGLVSLPHDEIRKAVLHLFMPNDHGAHAKLLRLRLGAFWSRWGGQDRIGQPSPIATALLSANFGWAGNQPLFERLYRLCLGEAAWLWFEVRLVGCGQATTKRPTNR